MSTPNRLITGMPFPDIVLPTTDGSNIAVGEKGWRALGLWMSDPDGNVAVAGASTLPSVRPDLE